MNGDRLDEIFSATRLLMRDGRKEEACQILAKERDRAISDGENEEAAFYAGVRGSYLVVMGLIQEAYESYRDAERLSGGDEHCKISTARHLIYGMSNPEEGLAKIEEVLSNRVASPAARHAALALRGLAQLALSDEQSAIRSLEELLSSLTETRLAALSCDLSLAEEIAKKKMALELCSSYFDLIEALAQEEGQCRVLARIAEARQLP